MNSYFYKIFLPYTLLGLIGLAIVIFSPSILWWTLFFWLVMSMVGHSIGFHRLFAHRQFRTNKFIENALAIIGTLAAYGPLLFWVSSHQAHHKYTDTDKDPTTPNRGFWHSILLWNLKKACEKEVVLKSYPVIQILKNPFLMWLSKWFVLLNYVFLIVLLIINPYIALGGYALATLIERLRIGFFVNYLLHKTVPGSYQIAKSSNNSRNFWALYPLTSGFSLHNKHHEDPKSLSEKTRWYEIDLEHWICKTFLETKNDKDIKSGD